MIHELAERLTNRVAIQENGCWLWQGTPKDNGYGVFYGVLGFQEQGRKRQAYAHRLSYMLFKGDIPTGFEIDHLCRNTLCINPDHLEAVTRRVNLLRGNTVAAINAVKTHCPKGHTYDVLNTHYGPTSRKCRVCDRIRRRAYVERNREAVNRRRRVSRSV